MQKWDKYKLRSRSLSVEQSPVLSRNFSTFLYFLRSVWRAQANMHASRRPPRRWRPCGDGGRLAATPLCRRYRSAPTLTAARPPATINIDNSDARATPHTNVVCKLSISFQLDNATFVDQLSLKNRVSLDFVCLLWQSFGKDFCRTLLLKMV